MANIEHKDHKKDLKKRFVKALYSYVPVNNDELSLKVHDILEVIEETEEGWWKGILEGNVGMFPSNFVIELDGHPEEFNNKLMNELSPTKNIIKGKNVSQQEPMHRHGSSLLQANKENSKQSTMNSSISSSEIDGTTSSKCPTELPLDKKIITPNKKPVDSTAPRLPPKPVREQARALFPYMAQNEDELTLKEGDIITVISKEVEDKGWWKGELNNKIGVFPDNFVKVIKAEEQKKPERPDKPSGVISSKISLRTAVSEKSNSETSPKVDKKVLKTPPAKPPPPEMHKKDQERPLPPCPSKKPQPPHPVKKPTRVSVGAKLPGFSAPAVTSVKSPVSETSPPFPTYPPPTADRIEESKKVVDSTLERKEEDSKKAPVESEFDAVETSGKKLVHLTANRAKAPNRRPPSYIFLKDNKSMNDSRSEPSNSSAFTRGLEKDANITATDSRRRSEPLLTEIESLFTSTNKEPIKTSATLNLEKKPKIPPPRPFLPSTVKTSSTIKSSLMTITKGNSFDETAIKSFDVEKKDILSDTIPPDITPILKSEFTPQEIVELCSEAAAKPVGLEMKLHSTKEDIDIPNKTVTRKDFNEILKQVKELKETLEMYKNNSSKAISDLKVELEEEKRLRRAVEIELQRLKESQTT